MSSLERLRYASYLSVGKQPLLVNAANYVHNVIWDKEYFIVGGFASILYKYDELTNDLDILVAHDSWDDVLYRFSQVSEVVHGEERAYCFVIIKQIEIRVDFIRAAKDLRLQAINAFGFKVLELVCLVNLYFYLVAKSESYSQFLHYVGKLQGLIESQKLSKKFCDFGLDSEWHSYFCQLVEWDQQNQIVYFSESEDDDESESDKETADPFFDWYKSLQAIK